MPPLASLRLRAPADSGRYPFTVPAIRALGTLTRDALTFDAPVTFLVGENGSGKSTLLEGIAAAARLPAVGSDDTDRDMTLSAGRALGRALALTWTRRTTRGFYLRAEDFFGFVQRLSRERAEFLAQIEAVETEYAARDRSAQALALALMPFRTSLAEMERRYGIDLDANSHGEAYLRLFTNRLVPGGLYLLDEPEAALSPQSQLGLLALIRDLVRQDAQFVIATHAPILLSLPGAHCYSFDTLPPSRVAADETEHVRLTRAFLADRATYLHHLGVRSP